MLFMLLMLLIGWTILLPAVVVAGLYVASTVLGRRRAALEAPYAHVLADERPLADEGPSVPALEPQPRRASSSPTGGVPSAAARRLVPVDRATSERPPVGAGH